MNSFYTINELKETGLNLPGGGENVLISKKASIYGAENITIANNVRVDDFCILSGKITVGEYVHIAAHCVLFGGEKGIVLENFSGVSSRCAIYAESDDYSGNALTNPTVANEYRNVLGGQVVLRKHVIVGTGSCILPGVDVGEGTAVGSMSLVTKPLEEWSVYAGIPCKRIKDRSKKLLELEKDFLEKNTEGGGVK